MSSTKWQSMIRDVANQVKNSNAAQRKCVIRDATGANVAKGAIDGLGERTMSEPPSVQCTSHDKRAVKASVATRHVTVLYFFKPELKRPFAAERMMCCQNRTMKGIIA